MFLNCNKVPFCNYVTITVKIELGVMLVMFVICMYVCICSLLWMCYDVTPKFLCSPLNLSLRSPVCVGGL